MEDLSSTIEGSQDTVPLKDDPVTKKSITIPNLGAVMTLFATFGKVYSEQLERRPIIAKSCTAGR